MPEWRTMSWGMIQDQSSCHFLLYGRILLSKWKVDLHVLYPYYLPRAQSKVKNSIFRVKEWRKSPFTESLMENTNTLVSLQFIGPKEVLIFCFKTKLLISYANNPSSLILYRATALNSSICKLRVVTKCGRAGERGEKYFLKKITKIKNT